MLYSKLVATETKVQTN